MNAVHRVTRHHIARANSDALLVVETIILLSLTLLGWGRVFFLAIRYVIISFIDRSPT